MGRKQRERWTSIAKGGAELALLRDSFAHLEDRARVDVAATILYPFRKAGIPSPDEHIHRNRNVVKPLTSAKQPPVHEEELVLALTARTAEAERFGGFNNRRRKGLQNTVACSPVPRAFWCRVTLNDCSATRDTAVQCSI